MHGFAARFIIKRPNIELSTTIKAPKKYVTTFTPRNLSLNEMKKGIGRSQLPIIKFPIKS